MRQTWMKYSIVSPEKRSGKENKKFDKKTTNTEKSDQTKADFLVVMVLYNVN
ncbi:hypothetical protein EZS27_007340 [termite gut metagenome]|uniref:Uncharacterized protein n=1 Tax=termite gut metagenome TaxID=433724 RepID=A0A5J4SFY0_9ZZZZ